jgi:phosphatidylglycerophosphate synthase
MLEKYIRTAYQKVFVNQPAKLLIKHTSVTPNQITLLAALSGVLAGILLALQWSWLALIFLLLSGYFDTLDGTVARLADRSSAQGSALDIVSDRLVEFFLLIGFYSYAPLDRATSTIWLLGSFFVCVASFLVVGIFSDNDGERSFHYSPGLIERPEAFIFFILMLLLPSWYNGLAWILTVLTFVTASVRLYQFYQEGTK